MLIDMSSRMPDLVAIVVGAGMSGLCAAIALKAAGLSFVVLEKGDEVGGTWAANRYPGCACDIPSHLYGFSFAPNPGWSRVWAGQAEILAYLNAVVDRFELRDHIRLGWAAENAAFDPQTDTWVVKTGEQTLRARYLIGATGPLRVPKFPDIAGIDEFDGPSMHSARWDRGIELTGRRVGIIGSAASAVQMIPKLAPQTAHLTIFQRTANYIVPKPNRAYTRPEKWAMEHIPGCWRLLRWLLYWRHELRFHAAFTPDRPPAALVERLLRNHIARQIPDPVLREKVLPRYRLGCKRVLLEGDYYATLQRDDVSLITDTIARIGSRSVITETERHELDVLIYATGFDIWDTGWPARVFGVDGQSLESMFGATPRAWLGMAVPGFPNFFSLLGPNTGLGHNSVVWMVECQVNHIVRLMASAAKEGRTYLEIRDEVLQSYDADIHARMQKRVWMRGGCASWYQHPDGMIRSLWPDSTFAFWRTLRRVDLRDYRTTH